MRFPNRCVFYVSRKGITNECPNKNQNSSKFKNPMCFICGGSHQTQEHANYVSLQPEGSRNQTKHVAALLPTHQAEFAKRGFLFSVLLNGLQCTALRDTGCKPVHGTLEYGIVTGPVSVLWLYTMGAATDRAIFVHPLPACSAKGGLLL
jgi:hypothetical protein